MLQTGYYYIYYAGAFGDNQKRQRFVNGDITQKSGADKLLTLIDNPVEIMDETPGDIPIPKGVLWHFTQGETIKKVITNRISCQGKYLGLLPTGLNKELQIQFADIADTKGKNPGFNWTFQVITQGKMLRTIACPDYDDGQTRALHAISGDTSRNIVVKDFFKKVPENTFLIFGPMSIALTEEE
jgi:hypothetical protein